MAPQTFTLRPQHPKGKCKHHAERGMDVDAWDGRSTTCVACMSPKERAKRGLSLPDDVAAEAAPSVGFRIDRPTVTPPNGESDTDVPKPPNLPLDDDAKDKRTRELAAELLGYNADIVKGFAFLCQPIPADNFFVEDPTTGNISVTPRGQQAMLKPNEAKWIAGALVEWENAPQLKAANTVINKTVKPYMPVLKTAAAVVVVGWHGLQMVKMRDTLLTQWNQQSAAYEASSAGPEGATPRPATDVPADEEHVATTADGETVVMREVTPIMDLRHSA